MIRVGRPDLDSLEILQEREDAFRMVKIVPESRPFSDPLQNGSSRRALFKVGVQHFRDQILEVLPVSVGDREVLHIEVVGQLEVVSLGPRLCVEGLRLLRLLHDGAHVEHHQADAEHVTFPRQNVLSCFGGHPAARSGDLVFALLAVFTLAHKQSDAEIGDLQLHARVDQNVFRFHV